MATIETDGSTTVRPTQQRRFVYFVQAQALGLIKIGVANRLESRLRELSHGSPDKLCLLGLRVCDEGGRLEGILHAEFASDRAHGEWFRPSPRLLDFIEYKSEAPASALKRLNAIMNFPTMKQGRPNKEMMQQMAIAGAQK